MIQINFTKTPKNSKKDYLLGLEAIASALRGFSVFLLFALPHFFDLMGVTFECHLVKNGDGFKFFWVENYKLTVWWAWLTVQLVRFYKFLLVSDNLIVLLLKWMIFSDVFHSRSKPKYKTNCALCHLTCHHPTSTSRSPYLRSLGQL